MTLVMFSRGNISEKIRFGKLVKEGDFVLDMYAGIGYYTLPALIHGKASHVCACEWNPHAVSALRHNIIDNQVENKVTIFEGDCRTSALEHNLVDMFDRVSLGLLPSSEGGWPTAVRALKRAKGGWLHVHANVPDKEIRTWTDWLLKSLLDIVDREIPQGSDWVVICSHVERVKSFAPTVSHLVADIFVGPPANFGDNGIYIDCHRTGLIRNGTFVPAVDLSNVQVPSCALSPDGALSQSWMR
jgi:tRNA G37 N-methylase Trm5